MSCSSFTRFSLYCSVLSLALTLSSGQDTQVVTKCSPLFKTKLQPNHPPQASSQPVFNISLEGGCLKCGSPCLSAVSAALPGCVSPALAAGGALAGGAVDLNISEGES